MCANVFTEHTIVHVYIIVYTEMELFNLREIIIIIRKKPTLTKQNKMNKLNVFKIEVSLMYLN